MRPLIFSTALAPFNVAWTHFLFEQLPSFAARRQHLNQLSEQLREQLAQMMPSTMPSQSYIVPYILGDNHRTLSVAQHLQQQGYYCLPIRPPTVPKGTSRIRLSLTADMKETELAQFLDCLRKGIK